MLKIFKNFKGKEWIIFTISIIFVVSQVWLDLKLPDYMSEITQLVQTPGSEMSEILTSGGWMLLCALGSLIASIIVAALAATIAANLSARLRFKMFDKVQSFSMEEINNFSTGADCISTLNIIKTLGCEAEFISDKHLVLDSKNAFKKDLYRLDCGNSGTSMRLFSGILASRPEIEAELYGDESLSKRPMKRIIIPLVLMGAKIKH